MIDVYMTDQIQIIKITTDSWGAETRTIVNEEARIEANNKIIANEQGQEVTANFVIILKENSDIQYHYRIKILKLNGSDYYQKDKEFLPLKIMRNNNYIDTHIEVTV